MQRVAGLWQLHGRRALQCAAGNACSICKRRTCHKVLRATEAPCRHREHVQSARMSAACAKQCRSQPHCAKRAQRFGCHVHGNASSSLGPSGNGMSPRSFFCFAPSLPLRQENSTCQSALMRRPVSSSAAAIHMDEWADRLLNGGIGAGLWAVCVSAPC